jgi:hypothetical protein
MLKEHIEWLETHPDEIAETYKGRYKAAEEEIRPLLMKMYGATDFSGANADQNADAEAPSQGPKVEEVD